MSQGRCLCAPRSSRRPQWVFSLVPPAWPFCPLKRKCRLKGLAHVRTNSLIFAVTQQSWDILEFLKVSKKKNSKEIKESHGNSATWLSLSHSSRGGSGVVPPIPHTLNPDDKDHLCSPGVPTVTWKFSSHPPAKPVSKTICPPKSRPLLAYDPISRWEVDDAVLHRRYGLWWAIGSGLAPYRSLEWKNNENVTVE